jgi:anti-sigma factor ChrR (cupin superfamily)
MECPESLELLSEYHEGRLDEPARVEVHTHLEKCTPCHGVYQDLSSIVAAASALHTADTFSFPDEDLLWQRMSIGKRIIH